MSDTSSPVRECFRDTFLLRGVFWDSEFLYSTLNILLLMISEMVQIVLRFTRSASLGKIC